MGVAHDTHGRIRDDGRVNGQTSSADAEKFWHSLFTNIRNHANVFGLTKASCQNSARRAMRLMHF
jgi:hypothetical protein